MHYYTIVKDYHVCFVHPRNFVCGTISWRRNGKKEQSLDLAKKLTSFGEHVYLFLKCDVCVCAIHYLDLLDHLPWQVAVFYEQFSELFCSICDLLWSFVLVGQVLSFQY